MRAGRHGSLSVKDFHGRGGFAAQTRVFAVDNPIGIKISRRHVTVQEDGRPVFLEYGGIPAFRRAKRHKIP